MFRPRTWLSLLLLGLAAQEALAENAPCTIEDNGKYYDLNPLKASKDYEIKTPGGHTLWINACQSVRTESFALKDPDAAEVAGFVRRDHGDFAIGKVNTTLSISENRPRVSFSNGSKCKGDDRASALIEFVCEPDIFTGGPRLLAQLPPGSDDDACAFVIEWKTNFACPTTPPSKRSAFWTFISILAILFLVLLLSYTILGVLYNRFVLQLRGFDQIPQFSIESMRYHLREGLDMLKDVIAGLNIGGPNRAGGSLPRFSGFGGSGSGGAATNPVSHQSQASSGFGNHDNFERNSESGGFVRPQPGRPRPGPPRRTETNPVSHQTQVEAERTRAQYASPPPPPPKEPSVMAYKNESGEATREEREFMLGDDEEEGEELVNVSVSPSESQAVSTRGSPSEGATTDSSGAGSAAVLRGRDLGDGGVIRL